MNSRADGGQASVNCPTCGRMARFFDEPVGPFCSPRCKLADLGKWLAEDYTISEPLRPDHFDEFTDIDPENSGSGGAS